MIYKEYKDINHVYVVHRTTGFMVTGQCDYEEHEVVFTTDDYDEALRIGKELFPRDPSGWTSPSFTINVNEATTTDKGIRILANLISDMEAQLARTKKDMEENPNQWNTSTIGDINIHMRKSPHFDSNQDGNDFIGNFGIIIPGNP